MKNDPICEPTPPHLSTLARVTFTPNLSHPNTTQQVLRTCIRILSSQVSNPYPLPQPDAANESTIRWCFPFLRFSRSRLPLQQEKSPVRPQAAGVCRVCMYSYHFPLGAQQFLAAFFVIFFFFFALSQSIPLSLCG